MSHFKILLLAIILSYVPFAAFGENSPIWIQQLPKAPGKVYGIGLGGVAESEAKALEIAAQAARFDVIAQLRSRVEGESSTHTTQTVIRGTNTPATASSKQEVKVKSKTFIEADNLPSLTIEERFVDHSSKTAYVLASLDVKAVESLIIAEINSITKDLQLIKANEDSSTISNVITLQKLNNNVLKLEKLATLMISVSDIGSLKAQIQSVRLKVSQLLSTVRKHVTVGLSPKSNIDSELKSLIRTSMNGKGILWNEDDPSIILDVQVNNGNQAVNISKKTWWELKRNADFIGIRSAISCALLDSTGNTFGSFEMDAKGVGVDEFTAKRALIKELRTLFPLKLQEAIDSQMQVL